MEPVNESTSGSLKWLVLPRTKNKEEADDEQ